VTAIGSAVTGNEGALWAVGGAVAVIAIIVGVVRFGLGRIKKLG